MHLQPFVLGDQMQKQAAEITWTKENKVQSDIILSSTWTEQTQDSLKELQMHPVLGLQSLFSYKLLIWWRELEFKQKRELTKSICRAKGQK